MGLSEQMCNQMDKDNIADLKIVENFFDDINLINELASLQKYYNVDDYNFMSGHSNTWPGVRTECLDKRLELNHIINYYVKKKFNYNSKSAAYFFHKRGSKDNVKDWVHKDPTKYACIIFLSKTNLESGTVFYNDNNQIITDIGFVQNRAIFFNGQVKHKSKLNYGKDDNLRLTCNGFFHD